MIVCRATVDFELCIELIKSNWFLSFFLSLSLSLPFSLLCVDQHWQCRTMNRTYKEQLVSLSLVL